MDMKTQLSVRDFFELAEVKVLQDVQKRFPYGSKEHREAFKKMAAMAKEVGGDLGDY